MNKRNNNRLLRVGQRLHGALTKVRDSGGMASAVRATLRMVRREGLRGAAWRIRGMTREAVRYPQWVAAYDTPDDAAMKAFSLELEDAGINTLISVVVPVYNAPERHLREMIQSVLRQSYRHWELCIADDASTAVHVRAVLEEFARRDERIRVTYRPVNGHISEASNSALELARGSFVALLDHDDILPRHALGTVARYIRAHPNARLFYSDEDKVSEDGRRHTPHFKPDWDPELILQYNVFSHLGVFETRLMREAGGFRRGLEGSQDHDLILRCLRVAGNAAVAHIPHVLYHWRTIEGSTAVSVEEKPYSVVASLQAVTDHLRETAVDATAIAPQTDFPFVRIDYRLPAALPTVHVLIEHAGDINALRRCVASIVSRTAYATLRVSIVADADLERLAALFPNVQWGTSLDHIVNSIYDDYVCFVDERVEVADSTWLNELMKLATREGVGAVGASLWKPDGMLFAGGLVLTSKDSGVPIHAGIARRSLGYFGRAMLIQSVSALSWSCAVVRRTHFLKAGGFTVPGGGRFDRDVSLSRRIAGLGLRNVFVPRAAVTIHAHERPSGDAHALVTPIRDPAYNPNLALDAQKPGATFDLAFPPRVGLFG
ncbi:glycosyltransferase [Caballeronia sp. GAWG1-1]|uniref:glycosyltransferase family 2 protein n=1 Tax=Caballeronia sp. GAWG1-1 TaxID=2921742 RepID=UPI0020280C32|nr:glycosyltransferase [Caballeronia sp. GAWG1-1]